MFSLILTPFFRELKEDKKMYGNFLQNNAERGIQ
jgi:hypothetical protein